MNYIKDNKRRSSLSPNSLENLVRIRESGLKSVLKLNAVAISEIWLEKHRIPKKKPDDQECIFKNIPKNISTIFYLGVGSKKPRKGEE